jgi:hypothetical protein
MKGKHVAMVGLAAVVLAALVRRRRKNRISKLNGGNGKSTKSNRNLPVDPTAVPKGFTFAPPLQLGPMSVAIPLVPTEAGKEKVDSTVPTCPMSRYPFLVLHDLGYSLQNLDKQGTGATFQELLKLCPFLRAGEDSSTTTVDETILSPSIGVFSRRALVDDYRVYFGFDEADLMAVAMVFPAALPTVRDAEFCQAIRYCGLAPVAQPKVQAASTANDAAVPGRNRGEPLGRIHYMCSSLDAHITLPPWYYCVKMDPVSGAAEFRSQKSVYVEGPAAALRSPTLEITADSLQPNPNGTGLLLEELLAQSDRKYFSATRLNGHPILPPRTPLDPSRSAKGTALSGGDSSPSANDKTRSALSAMLLGNRLVYSSEDLGIRFTLMPNNRVLEPVLTPSPCVVIYTSPGSETVLGTITLFDEFPPGWSPNNLGKGKNENDREDEEALMHDISMNFTDWRSQSIKVKLSTLSGAVAGYFDTEADGVRCRSLVCPFRSKLYQVTWEAPVDHWSAELPTLRRVLDGLRLTG